MDKIEEFREERVRLNKLLDEYGNTTTKRFLNLDTNTYKEGALSIKVKELLGLTASAVLRCDDCITYHLDTCYKEGVTDDELIEALNVALIVGGSIVIPHLRRAIDVWSKLKEVESTS
ncbi:MAG: carboxymuconolactone decarboxylase family protein [Candidatus Zophobacter franzmannii]|jgi:AhpD family alkylhydroperoxidase|nr:carboxymuconolactone decarboxylase family protein [Candidatus Zophobacter franzmannii]